MKIEELIRDGSVIKYYHPYPPEMLIKFTKEEIERLQDNKAEADMIEHAKDKLKLLQSMFEPQE